MKKILLPNAAVVVAVLVAAAAGWAGYWHYIAARVPEGLAAWAQEQRVQGFVVRYGAVEVGGRRRTDWPVIGRRSTGEFASARSTVPPYPSSFRRARRLAASKLPVVSLGGG